MDTVRNLSLISEHRSFPKHTGQDSTLAIARDSSDVRETSSKLLSSFNISTSTSRIDYDEVLHMMLTSPTYSVGADISFLNHK